MTPPPRGKFHTPGKPPNEKQVSKASGALAITTKSSRSRKKARKNLNENPRKCRNYGTLFGAGEETSKQTHNFPVWHGLGF